MVNQDLIYQFDKSFVISYNNDYFCCIGDYIKIYNAHTGGLSFLIDNLRQPSFAQFSMDNKLFIKALGGYYVYDLTTKKQDSFVPLPKGIKWASHKFSLTPDSKFIIDFAESFPFCKLMLIDVTKRQFSYYNLGSARIAEAFYCNQKSKYYISIDCVNPENKVFSEFYCFDYPFSNLSLTKMPFVLDCFSQIDILSGKIAIAGFNNVISIFDFDENIKTKISYDKDGVLYSLKWSKNGRFLVLAETRAIKIVDVLTGKIIKTFDVNYGSFSDFYDNDTKLLIGTWECGYCYDIAQQLNVI